MIQTEKEKLKKRMSRDNPYNSFGSDNFINANTGGEVKIVTENWSTYKAKGGISLNGTIKLSEDEEYLNSKQYKYLNKLPPYLILDYLSDYQLDNNQELIKEFRIDSPLIENRKLSKLSEETLEFLLKKYN